MEKQTFFVMEYCKIDIHLWDKPLIMVKNSAKKGKAEPGPKKPLSSFFYFSKERRAGLIMEQPDLKVTEVAKLIGVEWHKLTDKERDHYVKKSMEDRSRYEKEKIEMLKKSKAKAPIVVNSEGDDNEEEED